MRSTHKSKGVSVEISAREIKFTDLNIPPDEYTDSREVNGTTVHYETVPNPDGTVDVHLRFWWNAALGEDPFHSAKLEDSDDWGDGEHLSFGSLSHPTNVTIARNILPGYYDLSLWG